MVPTPGFEQRHPRFRRGIRVSFRGGVLQTGVEPVACTLGVCCSIRLSYWSMGILYLKMLKL